MSNLTHSRRRVYPALDSLRALAAIAVVATHTAFWAGLYTRGLLGALTARLDFGVAIFFVLSGFLVSRPFLTAMADRTPTPSTGSYLWHRALRILPVYWICVVLALVLLPENKHAGAADWWQNLFAVRLFVNPALSPGLTQMWSLTTEIAFYLVLPLLMWVVASTLCRRRWRPRALVVALGAMSVLGWVWLALSTTRVLGDLHSPGQWLPSYLSWFAVGMVLMIGTIESSTVLERLGQTPWASWFGAGAILVAAATPIAGPTVLQPPNMTEAVTKNVLYAAAAALIVAPAIFAPVRTGFITALSNPFMRHVGHISYSLFCCHLIVLELIFRQQDLTLFQGHGWELFTLTLLLSLAFSELLYRLVEKPSMRLRRSRAVPPKTDAAPAPTDVSTSR